MRAVYLEIHGEAKPKGSMSAFVLKCKHMAGGPRAIVTHSKGSKKWEKEIRTHLGGVELMEGPLSIELWFFLEKPKTAKRAYPSVRPDIDKLERTVLDAINGIIEDDSRVVNLESHKRYAVDYGMEPGVCMYIEEMADYRAMEIPVFKAVREDRVQAALEAAGLE